MESLGFEYRRERVAPSEQDIQDYERHIGFRLPDDFREFIREYGETYAAYGVRWRAGSRESWCGVEWIDGIHPGSRNDLRRREGCGLPPGYLAFAEAAGGQLVYAVGPENHGCVYWIVLHEIPEDGSYRVTEDEHLIAHSFDEFVRGLWAERS
jgi:hypothetical protein